MKQSLPTIEVELIYLRVQVNWPSCYLVEGKDVIRLLHCLKKSSSNESCLKFNLLLRSVKIRNLFDCLLVLKNCRQATAGVVPAATAAPATPAALAATAAPAATAAEIVQV